MKNYTTKDTISFEQIEKWVSLRKNVLIFGDHGVGKTSIIKSSWEKLGLKFQIFSGSTLDPWVDLIGIPKLVRRNKVSLIEFARPQTIDEDLEAIFIDEYNRSQASVRNAVLELIQFGSINGRKFPKLKVVWAAANPPDSFNNYDVEEIDPAQEDRFHVHVKLSGKPCLEYFSKQYGDEVAKSAIQWHKSLPDDIRNLISPRRLDYALDHVINAKLDIREVLPDERINVVTLVKSIQGNNALKELLNLIESKDEELLKGFFNDQKRVQPCLKEIVNNFDLASKFILHGNEELVISTACAEEKIALMVFNSINKGERFKTFLEDHRKNHKKDPDWYDSSSRKSLSLRAALDNFLEHSRGFIVDKETRVDVPEIYYSIASRAEEEIIDEISIPSGLRLIDLTEASAKNILTFFTKIDFSDFINRNIAEEKTLQKVYSLIFSAFNTFYLKTGNISGASFYVKGCEKLTFNPKFSISLRTGGFRTKTVGKLSVSEENI